MGKNCIGIGEYESGGTVVSAVVTADRVPNASSAKPNHASFAVNLAASSKLSGLCANSRRERETEISRRISMTRTIVCAAALLASVTSAEAGCSKSALNGTWQTNIGGQNIGITTIVSNGVFYFGAAKFTVNTLNANCRGTGELDDGGTTYPAFFTAEGSVIGTSKKPNILTASVDVGGGKCRPIH